ncbi:MULTISPECIES: hypothetical protein [unclassified Massilia]|uniref:hypothetical protein n=1 Tax=unclassified Massilia TaxID=2609279 RepID=UPI001B816E40|nr:MULTISPECIES: hypothetical protein [unclassified Massilia]MBQ5939034.1 hypothetical protein [Massilia sp. AB1]MBQ5962415.1 hypothetical protein [Massilia sp. ZL223]
MKIKILSAFLLCIFASQPHAADTPLFRMAASPAPNAGGISPGMVFQEVERSDTASTVELLHPAGSVAAKSMFMLRGACALAKERGKRAFRLVQLSRPLLRVSLRFVSEEDAGKSAPESLMGEDRVVSAAYCDGIRSVFPE